MTSTMLDPDSLLGVREDRQQFAVHECEIRAVSASELLATGYASLFEDPYDVFGGPKGNGWTEIVDRQAFRTSLSGTPDVVFVLDHATTGFPLARTTSGDLKLSTDSRGLHAEARIDRRHPLAASVEFALEKKHLQEMSFAFRTVRQQWNADRTERRLLEVNLDKGDVSLVRHGANPNTRMGLTPVLEALSAMTGLELRGVADPAAVLYEARAQIDRLLLAVRPTTRTTMSLTEALRVQEGLT